MIVSRGNSEETTMRKSIGLAIPMTVIILYYLFWIALALFVQTRYPTIANYLPLGGISDLMSDSLDSLEPVYTSIGPSLLEPAGPIRLAIASFSAVILIIPVSWVYFMTSRSAKMDQAFIQTIVILPVVVTGIAMIVMNSIALAFSLAGIVAAVRFRFSLAIPSDAMYIFVSIGVGLGAGIGAVGIAMVISAAFVLTTLAIWRLEYGKSASGPFLRMMARRGTGEDDF